MASACLFCVKRQLPLFTMAANVAREASELGPQQRLQPISGRPVGSPCGLYLSA
jgi:hypothetical protein